MTRCRMNAPNTVCEVEVTDRRKRDVFGGGDGELTVVG